MEIVEYIMYGSESILVTAHLWIRTGIFNYRTDITAAKRDISGETHVSHVAGIAGSWDMFIRIKL